MKASKLRFLLVISLASIFTFVFYHEQMAINLFLMELLWIGVLYSLGDFRLDFFLQKVALVGSIISGLAVVYTHSGFAIAINILSILLLLGQHTSPRLQSLFNSLRQGFQTIIHGIKGFFQQMGGHLPHFKYGSRIGIVFFPLMIVIIFVGIYASASPYFNNFVLHFTDFFSKLINQFFANINLTMLGLLILGVLISSAFLYPKLTESLLYHDQINGEQLIRAKTNYNGPILGIKHEYQSGILLLVALNIIIFLLIVLDIYWVWFNFSRDSHYLKQFVHEGTYLLILAILLSVGLVLFYFKNNLNFYSKNGRLKKLTYIWLAQNAVLTMCIGMRNYRYIENFGIAHKRIGLIFFLAMTLIGLWLVYTKVAHIKTVTYLKRKFSVVLYIGLVGLSLLNWDSFIARYNINHYETAILDLPFLYSLTPKAIPDLQISKEKLAIIQAKQIDLLPDHDQATFEQAFRYYPDKINNMKIQFAKQYQTKHWLSWNWADYRAYRFITQENLLEN